MVAISVIMPVYNLEKYLNQSIDSLINQTFKDFEIICVNDGSTDSSLKILDEYSKKYSHLKIINQNNQGAGEARNNGTKQASGEYIIYLDGDDFFEPTLLEELYNKATEYGSDITICSAVKIDENDNVIERGNPIWPFNRERVTFNKVFSWRDYPDDIFDLFNVVPWNKLYKKELIIKNNIKYQNLSSCNDITFSHIARILAEKIIIFDKELINYRHKRHGSISDFRGDSVINVIHSAMFVKEFIEKNELYEILKPSFINAYINHIRAGVSYCNDRQYDNFIKELKKLIPNEWIEFQPALKKDYITAEYLNNFIGNQKVYLWGASAYIQKILEKELEKNPNILGFIDKNIESWGEICCNYEIFSPEILNEKPANIILTVYNNNEKIYRFLKKDLEKYPNIKLLDNIFEN